MHCIERTLRFPYFLLFVTHVTICFGKPSEELNIKLSNATEELGRKIHNENGSIPIPELPLHTEPAPTPQVRPFVPPINTGPGNYLETRRVQMEGRLQRVETQVNLLLEAQRQKADAKPDPEQESNTAIQYGLNCERGESILVCLMKKVVILRREMSGIRRDVSDMGKRVAYLEMKAMEAKDTSKGSTKNVTGEGEKRKGYKAGKDDNQGSDSTLSENENLTPEGTVGTIIEIAPPKHDPFCPPKYDRVGSLCYYVVRDRTGGVASSRDFCQSQGGYLARPRDSLTIHDLANHLTHMNESVSELWVDGQYQTEAETWRWKDGQQIDSSIWGLPDTPSKYHRTGTCVLLKKELNYLAMPQDCGYHYFFVCQAEPTKATPSV